MPGYAGRHTGNASTAGGAGRLSLKVTWKGWQAPQTWRTSECWTRWSQVLAFTWGEKTTAVQPQRSPVHLFWRAYFVLLKSICSPKHQHEHMVTRNWMEVSISPSLMLNGPKWKAAFVFAEPLEQQTCKQFPLSQSMPCPTFLPHNQIFWWCFMLDLTN